MEMDSLGRFFRHFYKFETSWFHIYNIILIPVGKRAYAERKNDTSLSFKKKKKNAGKILIQLPAIPLEVIIQQEKIILFIYSLLPVVKLYLKKKSYT